MRAINNRKKQIYIACSIVLLIVLILVSLKLGSIDVGVKELICGIFFNNSSENVEIIKSLRLPRVIVAVLVGMNLSISGVLLQAVIRNPLADPSITGISSGASLVCVAIMSFWPEFMKAMPIFGFLGAAASCSIVYFLSYKRELSPMRIVLAGAAMNAMLGGFSSMITISGGPGAASIQRWISGSLATTSWIDVKILVPYSLIGVILAITLSKVCNVIVLGSKNAKSLGLNWDIQIILITMVAVFLAGISTSVAGIISFVGLVVPHICRLVIGSDHKYLIPFSGIVGGIFLIAADTIGRIVIRPYEAPVGIVMAILGAPFFLYILRRSEI